MIFAIIMLLTEGLQPELVNNLSMLHPPFLLGLITGGAIIYWFTGASTQAVSTGAYRAVEFIKQNINLDAGATKASVEDSKKVVEICTKYAQKGMFNIFLAVFFSTLAFACANHYFFIGYLISIAVFGLYQAIFKDTSSVALNPVIKFTTLFGLLAVELAITLPETTAHIAALVFFLISTVFVWRSFYGMRIPVLEEK
jgi:K(+)-stimulated pyrophosphate-energized sodium pump